MSSGKSITFDELGNGDVYICARRDGNIVYDAIISKWQWKDIVAKTLPPQEMLDPS